MDYNPDDGDIIAGKSRTEYVDLSSNVGNEQIQIEHQLDALLLKGNNEKQ